MGGLPLHIVADARGHGLALGLLNHLIAEATSLGVTRLSLETGAQETFKPACALYGAAGFKLCGPFAQCADDPNSVYMTRALA